MFLGGIEVEHWLKNGLKYFIPTFHFYTPWIRQKTIGFMNFLGNTVLKWQKWVKSQILLICRWNIPEVNEKVTFIYLNRVSHHYVKSVQIRSFFWSVFSGIWTEYGKICTQRTPYLDTFHVMHIGKLQFSESQVVLQIPDVFVFN